MALQEQKGPYPRAEADGGVEFRSKGALRRLLDRSTAYDSQKLKWPVYGECSMAIIGGATRSVPVKLMSRLESPKN